MRWINALFLYSLVNLQTAWSADTDLKIGTLSIHAAIANTPLSRERGLMKVTHLCENCGMLFVFPRPEKYSFWMKDTQLPLSIAFIAADGHILNIAEMQANTTRTHSAQGNALYALEMNKGWFTKHAIEPKTYVRGLQHLTQGQ